MSCGSVAVARSPVEDHLHRVDLLSDGRSKFDGSGVRSSKDWACGVRRIGRAEFEASGVLYCFLIYIIYWFGNLFGLNLGPKFQEQLFEHLVSEPNII